MTLERSQRPAAAPFAAAMPPADDDELAELVARAREGDREAFAALYRRCAPGVRALLLASVPPHDADDLLQTTFLAAWRGLDGLREDERFGAWVAGIARLQARRSLERRPRPTRALPEDVRDERAPRAQGEAILDVLRRLPEAYRETLALRLVEGLGGEEIAAATGLTPGSVRVNLHRGMALLRERLVREGLA